VSVTPAILAVDPALVTGLAMIGPEPEQLWACTVRFTSVPPTAQELHFRLSAAFADAPWDWAPEWHYAAERMFTKRNPHGPLLDSELSGMLTVGISYLMPFASEAHPVCLQWRTILGPGAARLPRKEAKQRAVEHVAQEFGYVLKHDAAEAVCIGLWRRRELEREAVAPRLGLTPEELAASVRRRKPGAGTGRKRARVTEEQALALVAEREERR
jgi:hypothetical protein